MIRVGVTGGIGSGKSAVCQCFARLGVPVYDSDSRAKMLMDSDGIRRAIVDLLGEGAYRNGVLDRSFVAAKVFSDKMLLAALNAIVHPAVAQDFGAWTLGLASHRYVLMESAILFESGFDRLVDRVIAVSAPAEMRLERILADRGISREEVVRRMENQLTDPERESRADFVVHTTGTLDDLFEKVQLLDSQLKNIS